MNNDQVKVGQTVEWQEGNKNFRGVVQSVGHNPSDSDAIVVIHQISPIVGANDAAGNPREAQFDQHGGRVNPSSNERLDEFGNPVLDEFGKPVFDGAGNPAGTMPANYRTDTATPTVRKRAGQLSPPRPPA